jgi:hypothetical protein
VRCTDTNNGNLKERQVETYNIYMDEASADGLNGDTDLEVTFRVTAASTDTEDAEENAVIVGLDLVDLLNLRDALQNEIDSFTLQALEATGLLETDEFAGDEDLP